jgi:predicted Fe-Mo cluster-binding NifX family protein
LTEDKGIEQMKIAIAAMTADINGQISNHGARALYYLVFDKQGQIVEALSNPYTGVARGAALHVARLLDDKGVSLLAAGDFGPRFVAELEQRGIDIARRTGQVSDVVRQLTD